jgi:hypothetical protein
MVDDEFELNRWDPKCAPCAGVCYDFSSRNRRPISDASRTVSGIPASIERHSANAKHSAPHSEQRGIRPNRPSLSLLALLAVLTLGGVIYLAERRVIENTAHN